MQAHGPQAAAFFAEGNRRLLEGDLAGAEDCFAQAALLAPQSAAALGNLALAIDKRGDAAEAERYYRLALAMNPALAQVHLNFGALLFHQGRHGECERAYRRATALTPAAPAAWSNLGVLLASLGREAEAEDCLRGALRLDAGHANARCNLGSLLLRQGRYAEGWQCLEARDWHADLATRLAMPRWRGEPLAGKSLLIAQEGGHGDTIQLVRYAPLLKARGAGRIGLLCHPALLPLFAGQPGIDALHALDAEFPNDGWDRWVPAFSLPGLFDTRLDTIPAAPPYLHADPRRVAQWQSFFAAAGQHVGPYVGPYVGPHVGSHVGLVWQGNPRFENDADRSLPGLQPLAPLGRVPGARFYSLQKGPGAVEAATPPPGLALVDLGHRIADFADTAAIVAGLDLVISVDTAVAHLAGALGKPCWLLLPAYRSDWRWMADRTDSPWYPRTMRLFRQRDRGNWEDVVTAIAAELVNFKKT